MADDLSGGPPAPRPARTAMVLLVATVLAAGAALLLRRGVDDPAAAPGPVPTIRSPAASVPVTPSLAVGDVCPVRTDGRSALEVSFTLRSRADVPVALLSAEPELPLGGLRPRGWTLRDGDCGRTGRELADGLVRPAGPVVVTLLLGLPPRCPRPYPVLVVLHERRGGAAVLSSRHTLLADLGGIPFDTC